MRLPLATMHRCHHEPGETGFNKTELTTLGNVVKCCLNISRNTLHCVFCIEEKFMLISAFACCSLADIL